MEQITTSEIQVKYAGFWVRVLATFIDFFALIVFIGINIMNLYYWKIFWLALVISIPTFLYKPFMEMKYGATLGKMALDLKVVTLDNRLMNLRETLLRYSPWLLSGLISLYATIALFMHPLFKETTGFMDLSLLQQEVMPSWLNFASTTIFMISVLVVAFHPQKRGLHDLLAGTVCIRKPE